MDESPIRVTAVAELQDVRTASKTNGADYDVVFEVPIQTSYELAMSADGHDVTFRGVFVGAGALIRRSGITRDADGSKHAKIVVRLAQSELRKSFGKLGEMVADNMTRGEIIFEPSQITLDEMLTKRATDDEEEDGLLPE